MILEASKRLRKFFDSTLTDEMIWKEIIEEHRLNNIHQLRRLNPEAARALILQEKRMEMLSLGITELPPDVAGELAKYKGEKLFLNCVTVLSVDSAKSISGFPGFKLMLNGVRNLSIPILGRLATYKGMVYLDGVEDMEISDKDVRRAQTVFRNLEFNKLSLSGLKNPSLNLLTALGQYPGQLLLNGISTLSDEAAETLGECQGNGLSLKGLNTLSFELLKVFTQFTGFLDVSGALEIDDEFVSVAAARPDGFSMFSGPVKRKVELYKKEAEREKRKAEKDSRAIELQALTDEREARRKEADLLTEFEKFDSLIPVQSKIAEWDEHKHDPHSPEIQESVVDDIEANLNQEIIDKRKRVDELLSKGINNLSDDEKALLDELRENIESLKQNIRGALDILVEKKELGSVVFGSSDDLAAYLKESGAEDDEDDALANIDDMDMFGSSFGSGDDDDEGPDLDRMDMFGDGSDCSDDDGPDIDKMDLFGDSSDSSEKKNTPFPPDDQPEIEGDGFVFTPVDDD